MAQRFDAVYKVKAKDNLGAPTFWNVRFQDIDARLNLAESQYDKFDAQVAIMSAAALARVNDTLDPLLVDLNAQVVTLTDTVTSLQSSIVGTSGSITTQLDALLAQAQADVAALEALGDIDGGSF